MESTESPDKDRPRTANSNEAREPPTIARKNRIVELLEKDEIQPYGLGFQKNSVFQIISLNKRHMNFEYPEISHIMPALVAKQIPKCFALLKHFYPEDRRPIKKYQNSFYKEAMIVSTLIGDDCEAGQIKHFLLRPTPEYLRLKYKICQKLTRNGQFESILSLSVDEYVDRVMADIAFDPDINDGQVWNQDEPIFENMTINVLEILENRNRTERAQKLSKQAHKSQREKIIMNRKRLPPARAEEDSDGPLAKLLKLGASREVSEHEQMGPVRSWSDLLYLSDCIQPVNDTFQDLCEFMDNRKFELKFESRKLPLRQFQWIVCGGQSNDMETDQNNDVFVNATEENEKTILIKNRPPPIEDPDDRGVEITVEEGDYEIEFCPHLVDNLPRIEDPFILDLVEQPYMSSMYMKPEWIPDAAYHRKFNKRIEKCLQKHSAGN